MQLQEQSWTDVRDSDATVAVLPVGSTEQHGPHNPLGVDAIVAREFARAACEGTDAVCLPGVEIGVAEHHRAFDGTLYVSPDTLRDYVAETLRSLTHHGIDRAVVVNGHGGNSAPVEQACARLTRDGELFAVMWEWFSTREVDVGHGGKYETALMMHLRPELVGEPVEGDAESWGRYVGGASVAHDTDEFTANGITGDAREATPELGEELFGGALADLRELLAWVRTEAPDASRTDAPT